MGYFPRFRHPNPAMNEASPAGMKFETALAALEQVVRDMESGELELEQSITAYRHGTALLRHCRQQLVDAEAEIRVLTDTESGEFVTKRLEEL